MREGAGGVKWGDRPAQGIACVSSSYATIAHLSANRHSLRMSAASRTKLFLSYAITATALLLAGCTKAQQQVAGRHFNVPSANLIPKSDYPFFLPKSQDQSFIFILNPEAELRQRTSVLVQERVAVCERATEKDMYRGRSAARKRSNGKTMVGLRRGMKPSGPTAQKPFRAQTRNL